MSVRPLDLQINMNSSLGLAEKEGLKVSHFETKQVEIAEKQNQDQQKGDNRVNFVEDSKGSAQLNHHKISSDHTDEIESDHKRRKPQSDKDKNDEQTLELETKNVNNDSNLIINILA